MKRHQEAIDALRRARATIKCAYGPSGACLPGCGAYGEDNPGMLHIFEMVTASALLDGLAVSDVTAAEEALDG